MFTYSEIPYCDPETSLAFLTSTLVLSDISQGLSPADIL
jgi:hypothetical protein